jgi:hypothetical protein
MFCGGLMASIALGISKMMEGMFITKIDGLDSLKCVVQIATNETSGLVGLICAPEMQALQVTEEFTNAPCLASYNDVVYLFCPNGDSLMYATYGGTGWSTSPASVPGANPACGASAIAFNGLLYVFYQGGGGSTASQGLWYNVFNGSSWSSPNQVSGVSMANSSSTCSPTVTDNTPILDIPVPAQYASAPSAVIFNTQLYVFYQGAGSGQLWYAVFNGTSWIENSQVSGTVMSCSPSATVYNNDIYVFYQGESQNGQLWYALFDGSSWSNVQVTAASAGITASPQVGVYQNNIVVVHQQGGEGALVYYLYYDGSSWSPDSELTPIALSNSPGPFVFNNELYVSMQDKNSSGQLWYTGSDGSNWSLMDQVSGASMSYSPAPIVFNNNLYCFYNGPGEDGLLYYSKATTGWNWSSPAPLNPIELSASPSALCFNNQLICLFQDNSVLFCTFYDASKSAWSQPFPLPASVIGSASAAVFNGELYIFYQAAGTNGQVGELWYITGDPTTTTYTQPVQISGVNMLGNPSAAVFGSQLYVFYQSSGVATYSVFDGTNWTGVGAGPSMSESPSAVVYTAPGTTSAQLYVFYRGATNDGLYFAIADGTSWSAPNTVPNTDLEGSPSAVVFNQSLYLLHLSTGGTALFYNVFNGATWAGDTQVSNVGITDSPAGAVMDNQLYVFHEGGGGNEELWYSVLSTSGTWAPDTLLHPWSSSTGPSMVSYNNVVYCFYETCGQLCYMINAGGTNFWTTQMLVPAVTLTGPPTAVLFNELFYIFYQGASDELWYVTYDSSTSTWSSPAQVSGATLNSDPSAAVFSNQIFVFYQGVENSNGNLWYNSFNGTTWSASIQKDQVAISASPSSVVFNGQLYVFHQGGQNCGELWYSIFNTSGSWGNDAQVSISGMTGSPSAAALGDQLCVFHASSGSGTELYYIVFNGSSWAADTQLSGVTLSGSPAAAALNNYSLWVIYGNAAGQLSCSVCSGELNWGAQTQVVPQNFSSKYLMSFCPAPVIYNNTLYVFYMDGQQNGGLYYTYYDAAGNSWAAQTCLSKVGLAGSPSPVVYNNQLYVFHQGYGDNGQLWCSVGSLDGSGPQLSWQPDTQIQVSAEGQPPISAGMAAGNTSPSAVVFDGQIYCFYNMGGGGWDAECCYVILDDSVALNGTTWSGPQNWVTMPGASSSFSISSSPAAIVYNNQLYVFAQGAASNGDDGNTQLLYCTSGNPADSTSWSGPSQAGHAQAAVGGNILAVAAGQAEAVAEPLVDSKLLPENLFQTAFIKEGPDGNPMWVKPKFELVTSPG